MMLPVHVKMAIESLRSAKWRSLLTMMGVIIGVMSVITTVSLGEGLKRQVVTQINQLGNDIVTVRPGRGTNSKNALGGSNSLAFSASTLREQDAVDLGKVEGVEAVTPVAFISGNVTVDGKVYEDGSIVATNEYMPRMLKQHVAYGNYFGAVDQKKQVAIIGKHIAERAFHENVPLGRLIELKGESFIVSGIFEEFPSNPLNVGIDFNNFVYIPYEMGKQLTGGNLQIFQILVKSQNTEMVNDVSAAVQTALTASHDGQQDFTVAKQDDSLEVTNTIVNLITVMIAGIAAISLLVGGVGIMNIMLVSVIERTREIGIRKAVGASNRQILAQFVTEASLLGFFGGLLGIALAFLLNFILRVTTDLAPVATWPLIVTAAGISLLIGLLFGLAPALKAARKEPIDALRHD